MTPHLPTGLLARRLGHAVLALLPLVGPLGIEAVITVIALGLLGLVLAARRWTYPGAGSGV